MTFGITKTIAILASAAIFAGTGCNSAQDDSNVGSAKVRIVSEFDLTRVVVSAIDGTEIDLERDLDGSGAFVGSLVLSEGPNELVGRAFVDDTLVGESAPVPVNIEAGLVIGATIRILDLSGGSDIDHGPVMVALTHPLSGFAGEIADLAVTAVDPDGDPIDVEWTSNCPDSVFSDPRAATTQWIKDTQGACQLSVTATSNGLSVSDSFNVVVFDGSTATGAVEIDGAFVSAPNISLNLSHPEGFCSLFPGTSNGTCGGSIAAPSNAFLEVFIDWGAAGPGSIELFDSCGGALLGEYSDPFFANAIWFPPSNQAVCLIGARAVSPDGVSSELTAALLVRGAVIEIADELISPFDGANLAGESTLGNVIADAQQSVTRDPSTGEMPITFMNPGGIRASLSAGTITRADLEGVHPFGNTLVTMTLTGDQLHTLLEQQFTDTTTRILQVGQGFSYTWSASAPVGDKVDPASMSYQGLPIDPTIPYRVTVNSFIAGGGDGFAVLLDGTERIDGALDVDALSYYLLTNAPLSAPALDRINRID